jgi:AcrR family transcriptional regulator
MSGSDGRSTGTLPGKGATSHRRVAPQSPTSRALADCVVVSNTADHDAERSLLLRSAFRVIRRNGYGNAQITDILTEAGVGTRAFYRHFASKDDVLRELFHENATRSREMLEERIDAMSDPLGKLLAWIEEMLDLAYTPRRRDRARLFRSAAAQVAYGDEADLAIRELYAPLTAVLREGAATGAFPTCDPIHDGTIIHAIVWPYFTAAVQEAPLTSKKAAYRNILRFCLPALGVDPSA